MVRRPRRGQGVRQHHQRNAGSFSQAAICVAQIGIKIDGIAGFQHVLIAADHQLQGSTQHMDELETLVHMGPAVLGLIDAELRQVRLEFSLAQTKVETHQSVAVSIQPVFGSLVAILFAGDGDDPPALFILKEVIQRNIENRSNAQQRGDGRNQLSVFYLGQESGRKPSALSKLRQAHAAAQPQSSNFLSDQILGQLGPQRIWDWHSGFLSHLSRSRP